MTSSDLWAEVLSCRAMARTVAAVVDSGERLAAARAAVELAMTYDRVLDNIQLLPVPVQVQQSLRDRLAPVTALLKQYRLR
jgi:hypothetical protein